MMSYFKFYLSVFLLSFFVSVSAQQPVKIFDKKTNTEVLYKDALKWQDGSVMNDAKVDGVIFIKQNGKYYQRDINESINVKWFGAKGDGKTDDTKAFQDMLNYLEKIKLNYRVFIPEGEYIITKALHIKGNNTMPIIQGAGMRNTILNFSNSADAYCIQFGEKNRNSLSGGLLDLQIRGNGKNDALIIMGSSPYGVAWCRFENLYFYNINNGIVEDKNIIFFSSHFSNIHIEKYYGIGMTINGGYNTYSGIFIVQPSGQNNKENPQKNLGSKNLAMDIIGGNNSFYDVQSEDQIKIVGGYNTFNALVIEYIIKSENYKEIPKAAIWVAGANTIFNKLKIIGLKSSKFDYLMSVFGPNITIMNAMYEDEGKKDQTIKYPFLPSENSSGVMMNCILRTTYKLNAPEFYKDTKNWSFINMEGSDGKPFSRFNNEGFKMSLKQRDTFIPEEGTEIFNTTTKTKEFWDGKQWKQILTK